MTKIMMSDGWNKPVPIEMVKTSTKYLEDQIARVGELYNFAMEHGQPKGEYLNTSEQQDIDALIHWLTEIHEKAKLDDTVILEVVE